MQRDCNLDNFCNSLNIFGIKKWTQRTKDDKYLDEVLSIVREIIYLRKGNEHFKIHR